MPSHLQTPSSQEILSTKFIWFSFPGCSGFFFLYTETKKSRYIYFAVTSIAFVITIKETYILTFAVYALSLAFAYCYEMISLSKGVRFLYCKDTFAAFANHCKKNRYAVGISVGILILITFLFYSSFLPIIQASRAF